LDKAVHLEIQHLNTVEVAQEAQVLLAVPAVADIQEFLVGLAPAPHLSLQAPVAAQVRTTV
jgi:hypothetical protein